MQERPNRRIFLEQFKSISRAIIEYDDLNLLMTHIAEHLSRSFEVKGCSILLLDEREKQLFRVASFGISETYLKKGPLLVDDRLSALATGEPVFIKDFQNDPRVQYPEAAAREGLVSMLSVPVKFRGAVTGIIRIYHSDTWALNGDDLDSFCLVAELLGLVIENNGLKNFFEKVKLAMETLPLRMLEGL
jgi:signal transduction protein with GAF and PtsI domain